MRELWLTYQPRVALRLFLHANPRDRIRVGVIAANHAERRPLTRTFLRRICWEYIFHTLRILNAHEMRMNFLLKAFSQYTRISFALCER